MRIIRSWPAAIPPDRAYVVDQLERFVMSDYSYRRLRDYNDDILLIEWDMAISAEDLQRFKQHIAADPTRVVVAPYRVYTPTMRAVPLPGGPKWVHRRYNDGEQSMRFVDEGEPTCHLWGLGVTYLPAHVIREFTDEWPGHFNDGAVSGWYYRRYGEVPIAWDVRPIHLHYLMERV